MVLQMTVARSDGNVAGRGAGRGRARPAWWRSASAAASTDGDLTVEVRAVGSDRTGDPYTLRRDGGF